MFMSAYCMFDLSVYYLFLQYFAIKCTGTGSDVKRGQNLEARATRPRPKLRGRGQDYEVEAKAKNHYQ